MGEQREAWCTGGGFEFAFEQMWMGKGSREGEGVIFGGIVVVTIGVKLREE